MHDYIEDGAVDLDDNIEIVDCLTEPNGTAAPECAVFDSDRDDDLDMEDAAAFQPAFTGS